MGSVGGKRISHTDLGEAGSRKRLRPEALGTKSAKGVDGRYRTAIDGAFELHNANYGASHRAIFRKADARQLRTRVSPKSELPPVGGAKGDIRMKARTIGIGAAVLALGLFAAGCGSQEKENGAEDGKDPKAGTNAQTKPVEPVTLKFYAHTVLDDFEKYINQFVKKKFPHVTLQLVKNEKGTTIEELLAAGDVPDIIWEGLTNIHLLTPLKVPIDLTPLAKKHGFDFGKYDPKLVDSIKSYSDQGHLYYLPYNVLAFALQYNKDIFDKFGVTYPKDNMTWDEVIELGKKLTRPDNGVNYIGFRPPGALNRLQMQMGLPYLDAKTGKAAVATDGWKSLFELMQRTYPEPMPQAQRNISTRDEFLKTRNVAMIAEILYLQNSDMVGAEKDGFRWDLVTYPTLKDKPNVNTGLFSDGFVLPQGGKHADLAFQIISYLSTDPEVQLEATKNGRVTGLKDKAILEHAFENNPAAKGKNVKSLFNQTYPNIPPVTIYDREAMTIVQNQLMEVLKGNTDVNSGLKRAEEEVDKKLAELKAR
ncbi:extracellular solute-binding protein [Paenibacillus hemerocallicola]|uniref:Extracellular solute-binding protein n=2 Tax=Paenibacillus hemerocallicola TaxID=1172614 RepID=A0A5C4TAW1_9BACL|nr:extracellular solute-binding protein [Paenibacillus hemerocallicola]